jgi:hypothetical protein
VAKTELLEKHMIGIVVLDRYLEKTEEVEMQADDGVEV